MSRTRILIGLLIAVVFQTGILAQMVLAQITLLASPTEVVLQTTPVDPRDLFRGDYVVLEYDISSFNGGNFPVDKTLTADDDAYVVLKIASPYAIAVRVLATPPDGLKSGEAVIRGRVRWVEQEYAGQPCPDCPMVRISYPIDSYFVPEGTGMEIEQHRNTRALGVIVALNSDGDAAIKGLMMDGEKIYDTPLF